MPPQTPKPRKQPSSTPSKRLATSDATGSAREPIRFETPLFRPANDGKPVTWAFLRLPREASSKLPSRSMVSVEGTLNGAAFAATLDPDGEGGHWLKVDRSLAKAAAVSPGDVVTVELSPATTEPEPEVPEDVRTALREASAAVRAVWADITPVARRDWIHWIVSAKQAATRDRRIRTACDMLEKGKRRPCCFDRSGMYSKSLACPLPDTSVGEPTPPAPRAPKGKAGRR